MLHPPNDTSSILFKQGCHLSPEGCHFSVWAPEKNTMILHLLSRGGPDTGISMRKNDQGYFTTTVEGLTGGEHYYYLPDGHRQFPDPCSAFQPDGIHGPSRVIDHHRYPWQDDAWKGLPLSSLIFYELHVGTFTPEGDFAAIIPRLDDLAALGITAIELMPVAEFPGNRNWGYDGVFPYAVQHTYGEPDDLRRLVDACHRRGIAVFLDVVYNHLGKEGNHLGRFGPYFSSRYQTPWGPALNLDDDWSEGVRHFLIGNVLYWGEYYHLDGLRLDAVHEIYDRNALSFWEELQTAVGRWSLQSGRPFYLVAESDSNDPRTVQPLSAGGKGFHAQWLDDFHHAFYPLLHREGGAHYPDYGELRQLAKAYTDGFVFSGEYSRWRHRRHGASSVNLPGERFVTFSQDHDLPGNRPDGARLSALVDMDRLRLAAAAVLLSPYLPLLFMGEEYGDDSPFFFFSDYQQPETADALKAQRRQQFAAFGWDADAPDPQSETTFRDCILKWELRRESPHRQLLQWYRQLIALRRSHPLLAGLSRNDLRADLLGASGLALCRRSTDRQQQLLTLFNFSGAGLSVVIPCYGKAAASWTRLLASADACPDTLVDGRAISLPPWSASAYELNALPD